MKYRFISTLLLVLLLGCNLPAVLFGQAGADTSKGSVSLDVLDASGAIIQGASVFLSGPRGVQTGTTNDRGQAVFFSLVPGVYGVKVEFTGFRTAEIAKLTVSANQRTPVQLRLEPGSVNEVVTVTEEAAKIDTTTTTTGSVLSQNSYSSLPVGRNVSALFSLAPGSAPSGDSVLSGNPSISGSTGLENQYIIDGINTTDQGYGAFGVFSINYGSMGTGVNFDFVKEVQIKTGGFEAQYGQAMGGIVNIVTDSGGNKVHGSTYAYSAPAFAEAAYKQPNDFPRVGAPQSETIARHAYDFGVNVGGPFIENKFFWYGAFNPSFRTTDRMAPMNYKLRDMGALPDGSRSLNWVGKLNYNITEAHRLEATGFGDPSRMPMQMHRPLVRDDADAKSKLEYGTRNWSVKYNGMLASTTLLSASFAWNRTYFNETPEKNLFAVRDYGKAKPNGAYTLVGGVGNLETENGGDNRQYGFMLTRNANFMGGHQFDLGYGYNQIQYESIRMYSGGQWQLPAMDGIDPADVGETAHGGYFYFYPTRNVPGAGIHNNVYRQTRGNFGNPAFSTNSTYQNAFAQDAWQMNRYITAKVGLRWEQQQVAGMVSTYTFAANWAPRLGFIIDPTGSRKTKIFANWGRFFEKIPQDIATRAMSSESSYMEIYSTGLPPSAANIIPGSSATPYAILPTIWAGGTKTMYQTEVVAGLEREVRPGFVLSARFIHRNVNRVLEDISGITVEQAEAGVGQQFVLANPSAKLDFFHNATTCTSGPNCAVIEDVDPPFYTVDSGMLGPDGKPDGFPDPRRVYRALEIVAEKRFSRNWSVMANYRLAKLFGNYEGLFRNDNGQSDPNITSQFDFAASPALAEQFQVGVMPTDRRHIVNTYGNYVFKERLNIGMGWQILSGSPISKFNAHPFYANAGEIPVGGRGAFGRTPVQNYFDAKLEYRLPINSERYRLKVASDMFNIFNRKTVSRIDENNQLSGGVANADFLKPLTYARPFYARFSIRCEF